MSISDVMSSVTAIEQLMGQLDVPAGQVPAAATSAAASQGTFAAALNAAAASAPAPTSAPATSSAQTESTMLASILQQAQAQSLAGTLDPSDSSDSGSLDSLSGLASLEALLPQTTTAPADPTAPTATGVQVLGAAESQLGVTEQPPGSNDGPQIATYRDAVADAGSGEPWCASFVSWAAAQAGEPLGSTGQGFDSVAQLTDWAASSGRLLPASATPAPGDLILFGTRHVGVVESVNPDGSLTTVEGNYNNAVSRVHRLPSEATGYVQM
jgi:cell wall-associated NlpC family hydrolase